MGLILLIIGAAATLLVGNYFIDYALVPYSGGQDREVIVDEMPVGVDLETQEVAQIIQDTRKVEEALGDEWFAEVASFTEEVEIINDELTLKGHAFYQEVPTENWVVLVHGYQGSEDGMYPVAYRYYDQGFNVLTFNHRGMGNSEGDYITMGIEEQKDLILWIEAIIEKHPQANIVTHGDSMGSATVLMASGLESHPDEVVAVVSDSGYTSVWEVFESELYQRFEMPAFPALYMAGVVGVPRVGVNIRTDGKTIEQIAESKTPTLFIHGTADDFVPYPMVHALYEAHPLDEKSLYIVEGAGHTESKYLEPDTYYETVFSFIGEYINE